MSSADASSSLPRSGDGPRGSGAEGQSDSEEEDENDERRGGARVDGGEELSALDVIGKLVKSHAPTRAQALQSNGNEEVSDYQPSQTSDDGSEEEDIEEYDD
jgi:hypothetical protein